MAILASYVPIGKRLFYPMLNFFMNKILFEQNPELQLLEKFIFCRLVRENLKYVDYVMHMKTMPSEFYEEDSNENTPHATFIR
jgi:hypothetical protein